MMWMYGSISHQNRIPPLYEKPIVHFHILSAKERIFHLYRLWKFSIPQIFPLRYLHKLPCIGPKVFGQRHEWFRATCWIIIHMGSPMLVPSIQQSLLNQLKRHKIKSRIRPLFLFWSKLKRTRPLSSIFWRYL